MKLKIDNELRTIINEVLAEQKNEREWALIESSDMFQSKHFCGGYDATENAFCFSYYDDSSQEYWFQISLMDCRLIQEGEIFEINIRKTT